MENGERKKEKEDIEHAHKERNALQKEIDNRGKDLEKQQKRRKQRTSNGMERCGRLPQRE